MANLNVLFCFKFVAAQNWCWSEIHGSFDGSFLECEFTKEIFLPRHHINFVIFDILSHWKFHCLVVFSSKLLFPDKFTGEHIISKPGKQETDKLHMSNLNY
jgi:hypothetical protein